MKYRIGEKLHECTIDDETGRPSYTEWRIRSQRGGRWHAVQINQWTWIKLHWGRDQTYGWAPSIYPLWRRSWPVGETAPGLFRTRPQALAHERRREAAAIERRSRQERGAGA